MPASWRSRRTAVALLLTALAGAAPAYADITSTGDVSPANTATWTSSTNVTIGNSGAGTVAVDDGSSLSSNVATLGNIAGSQGSVLIDGPGSNWAINNVLNVGNYGSGSLTITNGGSVTATGDGNLGMVVGFGNTSNSVVQIDGSGSVLSMQGELDVGSAGRARIDITNGAQLLMTGPSIRTFIGYHATAGVVNVDGPGSVWSSPGDLYVGFSASGTLNISRGGKVTGATNLIVGNSFSMITMSVGDGSLLDLGGSSIFTGGTVSFHAAPSAIAGNIYSPIHAGSWGAPSTGGVQSLGGTWNSSNHTFTVSSIASGNAGDVVSIDRSQIQRMNIADPVTGKALIANFLPTIAHTTLSLTPETISPSDAATLQSTIGPGSSILAGWSIAPDGYKEGDPINLCFAVGSGLKSGKLSLWHFNGATWSAFTARDFNYDGTYANFTVNDFQSYAITLNAVHGDATLDGKVDAFDLNQLAAHWQQPSGAYWSDGDFNGDGKVDSFDLNVLAANWQIGVDGSLQSALESDPRLSGSLPIPEPTTLAIVSLGGTLLLRRRGRQA